MCTLKYTKNTTQHHDVLTSQSQVAPNIQTESSLHLVKLSHRKRRRGEKKTRKRRRSSTKTEMHAEKPPSFGRPGLSRASKACPEGAWTCPKCHASATPNGPSVDTKKRRQNGQSGPETPKKSKDAKLPRPCHATEHQKRPRKDPQSTTNKHHWHLPKLKQNKTPTPTVLRALPVIQK